MGFIIAFNRLKNSFLIFLSRKPMVDVKPKRFQNGKLPDEATGLDQAGRAGL
jgi:hypothetical protein